MAPPIHRRDPFAVTDEDRLAAWIDEIRAEIPDFRIVRKEGDAFSKCIDLALCVVTFGAQRQYMTRYVTTLGRTVYVPADWNARDARERLIVMRHEAVHLRQFRRYGFVLMAWMYLFPIFPLGLAWGRARLEWEAYEETLRATWELRDESAARDPKLRTLIIRQFTSGAYGWMWPFPKTIARWIDDALTKIGPRDR